MASPLNRRQFLTAIAAVTGTAASSPLWAQSLLSRPAALQFLSKANYDLHFPGEDQPHLATLMSWPHRRGFYLNTLGAMQDEMAAIAQAIAQYETVLMIAHPGQGATAQSKCGPSVRVLELPLDDCWMRDNGPVFIHATPTGGGQSTRVAMDFGFNAWGNPNWQSDNDDAIPQRLCERFQHPFHTVPFVLEGGAIHGDGEGTIYTTEECLLHPSRNGSVTKADVEAQLAATLGAQKVVWLPWGLTPNDLTEGHIDGVLALIEPGKVLLQQARPTDRPDVQLRAAENLAALQGQTDAQGRVIDIVPWNWMSDTSIFGATFEHTYLNFYLVNGAVIVPTASNNDDAPALAELQTHFPNRDIVGVECRALGYNGGGVHCVTQQVPI